MRTTLRVAGLLALLAPRLCAQGHEGHPQDTRVWRSQLGGTAFLQYIRTSGSRGVHHLGSVNRVLFETGGRWAGGTLRLHAMGSAEPVTLPDVGVPQPLQVAFRNGTRAITDQAHPSSWIMQLAASYERPFLHDMTVSFCGAAVGAPALGPPAYVHRASATSNSAVPLGHHAQDVTHSSFGVVTVGLTRGRVRLEGSAFNGRQPTRSSTVFFYRGARLDAYAARVTIAAAGGWSLSSSYGYLPATSGGHAHGALHRAGIAATYDAAPWSVLVTYGANDPLGRAGAAPTALVEGEYRWRDGHTLFARAEYVRRTAEELSLVGSIRGRQDIEAVQVGYARRVAVLRGTPARLGAHATATVVTAELQPFYGTRTPLTITAFLHISSSH